jgi:hypothetical protein
MMRLSLLALFCATQLVAQQPAGHAHGPGKVALTRDQLLSLAKAHTAIQAAQDTSNQKLAKSGNKTDMAQQELKDKFQARVAEILQANSLTMEQYQKGTFYVSSDTATRRVFDSLVVAVTGAPLPGAVQRGPQLAVPAGAAGMHAGHVVNSFSDTPNLGQGLLPTAINEARVAAQHATLAGRMPDNLPYMQLHVSHVMHAVDPSTVPGMMAPGANYGVKKAAQGVVTHIGLAAAAAGAPPAFATHTPHIAMAGKNTLTRVDQIIALGLKVRDAKTAAEAAALVSQIAALAEQLLPGADTNGDGRITVEEGGLQTADEHSKLMLPPRP